jgi:hypothetical protein
VKEISQICQLKQIEIKGLGCVCGNICYIKHSAADRLLRTKLEVTTASRKLLFFIAANFCGIQKLQWKKKEKYKTKQRM